MRRYITLMGVLALLGAALGCQHIAGKSDCGYNQNDYHLQAPTNPYQSAPPAQPKPVPPAPPVPPKGTGNE
jgi:hypothetical protein